MHLLLLRILMFVIRKTGTTDAIIDGILKVSILCSAKIDFAYIQMIPRFLSFWATLGKEPSFLINKSCLL